MSPARPSEPAGEPIAAPEAASGPADADLLDAVMALLQRRTAAAPQRLLVALADSERVEFERLQAWRREVVELLVDLASLQTRVDRLLDIAHDAIGRTLDARPTLAHDDDEPSRGDEIHVDIPRSETP